LHKSAIITALITFFLINASYAQVIKDLDISADSIVYSEDGLSLEASGSVEVISGDIDIKADHLVYYIPNKEVVSDKGYQMDMRSGLRLTGDYLDYVISTKKGTTKKVNISYKSTVITGDFAKISEEKIELDGTTFNTCGLEPPHYHVSTMTTTLYPDEGWVLGYYGLLWINQLPLLPVPVYIYDLRIHDIGKKTTRTSDVLAFPEVGSNDEDGNYVTESVPWIANRKLSGRFVISDTENGGLALGISGNWNVDDNDDINFRLFYDKRYWYYGGVTHTYRFGPPLGSRQEEIYTFLRIKQDMLLELITNMSVNERINYQSVSMLPEVTLRMHDIKAFFDNFVIGSEVAYGHIREASMESVGDVMVEDDRGRFGATGTFTYPLDIGILSWSLGFNQSWYGKSESWRRFMNTLKLSHDFGYGIDGSISHMHYVLFEGNSPFLFEKYYTLPSDEFGVGLGYNFFNNRLSLEYAYYVPDWEPKDLDYGLILGFHCYNVEIKYRATRKELLLGVSLVAQ